MLEKQIEKKLVDAVKSAGGMAFKFQPVSMNGVPDRIVLLKDGKVAFVELKAPGKKLRPLQVKRKEQIEALGFRVFVVDRPEQIGGVVDEILSP